MRKISYAGYRFPPEIIQQAIWLYLRFTLSLRDVEDLLAERGVTVSYETVRRWVNHFGPMVAADLRKRRPEPHSIWHLDEVYLKIDGCMVYLWRAVDAEGEVPDGLSCAQLGRSADGRCASEADVEAMGQLGRCGRRAVIGYALPTNGVRPTRQESRALALLARCRLNTASRLKTQSLGRLLTFVDIVTSRLCN
jgi:hypothetical protein